MPNTNNSLFPYDPEKTQISLAYMNGELVADKVFPRVPVGKQTFSYLKFDKGNNFTLPETLVGRKGTPKKVDFPSSEATAVCETHALDDDIPDDDIKNAPQNYDIIGRSVEGLTNLIALRREVRAAALAFDADNYASTHKIDLTAQGQTQIGKTTGDPIAIVTNGMEAAIRPYNKMLIGRAAFNVVRQNQDIVAAVYRNSGTKGIVTREAIAELFELDEVIVGVGWLNTAGKNETPVLERVWGKHILLFHSDPMADTRQGMTYGYTGEWRTRQAGSRENPDIGADGGITVRCRESVIELIVANDLGYFIENAVA